MDTTFISIHDLSDEARILYSSDSIVDILGHTPDEVVNRSVWQYFHPDELPLAKAKHSRGVKLDKAAVLSYCRLRNRQGDWIGCECCFSVVYDVMVCCTSVYRSGMQSQNRAIEAPIIRKLFASSLQDPRYHMLSHLSSKFTHDPDPEAHEPRAALFLNRFTRTLTVMYATSGIEKVIGISGEAMKGRSFYYCIAANCLDDAVKCLESAKGYDSIAYLRFFFRDPRQDDPPEATTSESEDEIMTEASDYDDDDTEIEVEYKERSVSNHTDYGSASHASNSVNHSKVPSSKPRTESGDDSGQNDTHRAIFGDSSGNQSSSSSMTSSARSDFSDDDIELEAVIYCTSDGLVVCLRRARPMLPGLMPAPQPTSRHNGIYAAPWAAQPMYHAAPPQVSQYHSTEYQNLQYSSQAISAAARAAFLQSIREQAVFAWALLGINGNLANYARRTCDVCPFP